LYESKRKIEIIVGVKIRLPVLTASVFETGAMAAPTILENPTVLGQGDPASTQWSLWQYGWWSFQTGGTKLKRFLPKNQHTQRKLLNFDNWVSGEVSKIGHHFSK
jgi:hypothetical protein